jgi:hypothetical protein
MRARGGNASPSALAAVRVNDSGPAGITLNCGVLGAEAWSISGRSLGAIFFAGLRSPAKNFFPSRFHDN